MALAADKVTPYRDGAVLTMGVKKNNTIYIGAVVQLNGGHIEPASVAANKKYLGVAETAGAVGNAAGDADGDAKVEIRRPGIVIIEKGKAGDLPDVGSPAYVTDDETVHKTQASNQVALGLVVAKDDDGYHILADWARK